MRTFKKFVQYYKPYKGVFFLDMFCAMVVSFIDLAFPQILSWMTKDLFMRGTETILKALPLIGIGLLTMYLIRYAGRFYITYQGHVMGAKMESDMRQDLFDRCV